MINLNKFVSIVLFTFIAVFSNGQITGGNCAENLKKEPYITSSPTYDPNSPGFLTDLEILATCGNMDSIDQALFLGTNLVEMTVYLDHRLKYTYADLLNEINMLRTADTYIPARERLQARMTIEHKIVDLPHFDSDTITLIKTGFNSSDLKDLRVFLTKNKTKNWTYKEAILSFADYTRQIKDEQVSNFKFNELKDYQTALDEAKKMNKKCLIYFTGYVDINSRKIEDRLFINPEIVDRIVTDFVYYAAYTDSFQKTPDGTITIGEKNRKLSKEKFNNSLVPMFYIVDENGKILAQQGPTYDTSEFLTFLTK